MKGLARHPYCRVACLGLWGNPFDGRTDGGRKILRDRLSCGEVFEGPQI